MAGADAIEAAATPNQDQRPHSKMIQFVFLPGVSKSFRFLILQMHKTENGIETTTTKIENKVGNATREFKKNIRGLMKSTHMHYAPQPTVERNGHKEREIEVK